MHDRKETLTQADIDELKKLFDVFAFQILGLTDESSSDNAAVLNGLMDVILDIRAKAKANKDWATSDAIRDKLKEIGITVKDGKDGATWNLE